MTVVALLHGLTRSRAVALAVLVSLVSVLIATPARAEVDAVAEAQFVDLINQERQAMGLAPLAVAGDMVAVARDHSRTMGEQNDLHHNPSLGSEVGGWQRLGENVGKGPAVSPLHDAFMDSSGHRANILDEGWTEIGVGVHVIDGRMWVTQIFRTPESAAPAPAPAPAPEPVEEDEPAETAAPAPKPAAAPAPKPAAAPAPAPRTPAAAADAPDAAPAPPVPLAQDRTTLTLARLEADEQDVPVTSLLSP